MTAFYNENDPEKAAWLRELIRQEQIAPGIVDERSIEDIAPQELSAFTQVHLFAGIGVWSYGLRRAGWPDDRRCWTASCPCGPFSGAGKREGFADERHLWPAAWHLMLHGKPRSVPILGEQVASPDGIAWLGLVQSDVEAAGYITAAMDLCSAGFGASDIRQRLYWLAYAADIQPQGGGNAGQGGRTQYSVSSSSSELADSAGQRYDGRRAGKAGAESRQIIESERFRNVDLLGDPICARLERQPGHGAGASGWKQGTPRPVAAASASGRLDHAKRDGRGARRRGGDNTGHERQQPDADGGDDASGPLNGFWRNADWLSCRDGKWRPVEPGTFPLVTGAPARVVRLRGYGDAINAETAKEFITAAKDWLNQKGEINA